MVLREVPLLVDVGGHSNDHKIVIIHLNYGLNINGFRLQFNSLIYNFIMLIYFIIRISSKLITTWCISGDKKKYSDCFEPIKSINYRKNVVRIN
jgi:hypothetical protein